MFDKSDIVHSYTRDEAIQDGVLVDLSHAAQQAGFTIPLALTARVFSECVYWPETEPAIQDETGRQWDVLYMAASAGFIALTLICSMSFFWMTGSKSSFTAARVVSLRLLK